MCECRVIMVKCSEGKGKIKSQDSTQEDNEIVPLPVVSALIQEYAQACSDAVDQPIAIVLFWVPNEQAELLLLFPAAATAAATSVVFGCGHGCGIEQKQRGLEHLNEFRWRRAHVAVNKSVEKLLWPMH